MILQVPSLKLDMGVSKNNGTPKSSILIGFSIINHPFWGTPIFGNTQVDILFVPTWIRPYLLSRVPTPCPSRPRNPSSRAGWGELVGKGGPPRCCEDVKRPIGKPTLGRWNVKLVDIYIYL